MITCTDSDFLPTAVSCLEGRFHNVGKEKVSPESISSDEGSKVGRETAVKVVSALEFSRQGRSNTLRADGQ